MLNAGLRDDDARHTLRMTQMVAAGLLVGPLPLIGVMLLLPPLDGLRPLGLPAVVAGIAAPLAGYLAYLRFREMIPRGSARRLCYHRFLQANIAAMAVTEAAALLGVLAFGADKQAWTLVGMITHIMLLTTIWPSEQRLAAFINAGLRG